MSPCAFMTHRQQDTRGRLEGMRTALVSDPAGMSVNFSKSLGLDFTLSLCALWTRPLVLVDILFLTFLPSFPEEFNC